MPAKIYTVYKGTYENKEKVFGAIEVNRQELILNSRLTEKELEAVLLGIDYIEKTIDITSCEFDSESGQTYVIEQLP